MSRENRLMAAIVLGGGLLGSACVLFYERPVFVGIPVLMALVGATTLVSGSFWLGWAQGRGALNSDVLRPTSTSTLEGR